MLMPIQHDSLTHLRVNNNDNTNKDAHAGQLNSFTHLRALLVLHVRDILVHATSVAGHCSSY
jgi:hypothetical protein